LFEETFMLEQQIENQFAMPVVDVVQQIETILGKQI
jgi:DNA polymerase-3 subunit gamma/tau